MPELPDTTRLPIYFKWECMYEPGEISMKCSVMRSSLKDYTYIYLLAGHDFEDLPVALKKVFGEPEFVINLELGPERTLAYEDVNTVMQNLQEHGYHLQLPPHEDVTGLLELPDKKETLL
jgi:uncharacterized protein YcgL (UPF0745 family)